MDSGRLWSAAVEQLAQRPFFAWLRFLRLDRIEGDTAYVTAAPGHREVQAIATPQRLEPIAQELTRLRGTRTRVALRTQGAGATAGAAAASDTAAPDRDHGPAAPSAPGFDRRAAMQVPLVRQVLDVFPDASLIEAREEEEPQEPSPSKGESTPDERTIDDLDDDPV